MRAGALRNIMTVQRSLTVGSTDSPNFVANVVWTDWLVDIPCEVIVRRGREHFDTNTHQRYAEDIYLVRTRFEEVLGIDNTMRVSFDGSHYDIRSIRPDHQKRTDVIIECTVENVQFGDTPIIPSILMNIPSGIVGNVYDGFTVSATGGLTPYTFIVDSGGILPGLDIDAGTGVVSGVPTVAGNFDCEVTILDAAGNSTAINFTVIVAPSVNLTAYSYMITAGQDSQSIGYVMGDIGSISGQPFSGVTVYSTAIEKAFAGSGKIEIIGDRGALEPLLADKEVWIDGVKIGDEIHWDFDIYQATWSISSGFPSFTDGNEYIVEFK